MELSKTLATLGLHPKQAEVYLALLQAGSASVAQLSKRAGTKRPTTYLILEELRERGLASITPGRRMIYAAESPERLVEEERQRSHLLKEAIPELAALYNSKKEKPKIRYYQGVESLTALYREIFTWNELDIFGSINAIHPEVLEKIWPYLQIIEDRKMHVRDLVPYDEASLQFAKEHNSQFHQIKIVSRETKLPTDNIIFGNSLAIFSYKDVPLATVIESSDVAETYRSLFNLAWESIKN